MGFNFSISNPDHNKLGSDFYGGAKTFNVGNGGFLSSMSSSQLLITGGFLLAGFIVYVKSKK